MAEASANLIVIKSEEEFNKAVAGNKVVLADFNATWCGPCRTLKPLLHELAKKNPSLIILDIDVDTNKAMSQKFKVQSIPYIILYMDGKKLKDAVGLDEKFFKEWLPKALPDINLEGFKIGK